MFICRRVRWAIRQSCESVLQNKCSAVVEHDAWHFTASWSPTPFSLPLHSFLPGPHFHFFLLPCCPSPFFFFLPWCSLWYLIAYIDMSLLGVSGLKKVTDLTSGPYKKNIKSCPYITTTPLHISCQQKNRSSVFFESIPCVLQIRESLPH